LSGKTGHEQIHRFVRDINDQCLELLTQLGDFGAHPRPHPGVEIGERLIEEKHFQLEQDRAPDCNPLSLPAGERVRYAIKPRLDPRHAVRVDDAFLGFRLGKLRPVCTEEISRDCAIWIRLGARQELTDCNSSCEKEQVVLMSRRNARTLSEEKPADCNALLVSPKAEGSTNTSKTLEAMLPLVYDELRLLAGGYLRNERPEHTLQRTALVHEAYLRLAAQRDVSWENPAHLIAIFARLMRQTLVNHAVARTRTKRGGSDPTDLILEFYDRHRIDVSVVDEALRELEALDTRQAQIVELRFFGGLRIEEIAKLLEISPATVKREWAVAKLWLRQTLSQGE
jgi:RNA polymerase sigma-70 factor (ECF subfamily)